jgi:hypothetical protein
MLTEHPPEIQAVLDEPGEFISRLCIMHKQEQRITRFDLNAAQRELLEVLQTSDRVIVLKARQLGVSTLTRAWHFWKAYIADEPRQYAVLSHTRASAEELHRIERTFYENLPQPLRKPLRRSSVRTLKFEDTGAQVTTYTASGRGGTRSFAMNSAHLSEFAFYENQEEVMATVMAAVGDGQVVIESTPNVFGDMFHTLVEGARSGENGWKLVFFPWYMHDAYQMEPEGTFRMSEEARRLQDEYDLSDAQMYWRQTQIRTLGKAKFRREYPCSIEECFRGSARSFFDAAKLKEIEPLDLGSREHRMYSDALPGDKYIIGVDVGAGVGGDSSAVTVVSASTRQPVYHYVDNQISPTRLAEKLLDFQKQYNDAKLIVESNNHGMMVLHRLRELRVRHLYLENGKDFKTSPRTRPLMFDSLREAVEDGIITHLDRHTLDELKTIAYINDKPQAPKNGHDDITISMCLCYYVLKDMPLHVNHSVRKSMMDKYIAKARARDARRAIPWNATGGNKRGTY